MVIRHAGGFLDPNDIAQWGTQWSQGRDDEEWEQLAITKGESMADKFDDEVHCDEFDRVHWRNEFILYYDED